MQSSWPKGRREEKRIHSGSCCGLPSRVGCFATVTNPAFKVAASTTGEYKCSESSPLALNMCMVTDNCLWYFRGSAKCNCTLWHFCTCTVPVQFWWYTANCSKKINKISASTIRRTAATWMWVFFSASVLMMTIRLSGRKELFHFLYFSCLCYKTLVCVCVCVCVCALQGCTLNFTYIYPAIAVRVKFVFKLFRYQDKSAL